MSDNNQSNTVEINIIDFCKLLLNKIIWIILAVIIGVGVGFGYAYTKKQTYSASTLMYINNYRSSTQDLIKYVTQSDLDVSKSLIDVFAVIMKTRDTFNDDFFDKLEEKGINHTYDELCNMISVGSKNNTEVLKITVTGENKDELIDLVNLVTAVFETRIEGIISGVNIESVEEAWKVDPISKGVKKSCAIGGVLGFVVAVGVIFVLYLLNNSIESEEWLLRNYDGKIPLLAVIPDVNEGGKKYGYGKTKYYKSYKNYYQSGSAEKSGSEKKDK